MAYAKETYLTRKVNGRGTCSLHACVPKRWAKDKEQNVMGVVFFDLTNDEDRQQYEKLRLEMNWG